MATPAAAALSSTHRVDAARSRDSGGSGPGLAIARWIAETHGGAISLTSRPGEGSTFTVRLPIAGAAAESQPENAVGRDLTREQPVV